MKYSDQKNSSTTELELEIIISETDSELFWELNKIITTQKLRK